MFSGVRYGVLGVVIYCVPQKVFLGVLCVSKVEAASCRVPLIGIDVVLIPFVVVVEKGEVEDLVVE